MKGALSLYLSTCNSYWKTTAPFRFLGCTPRKIKELHAMADFTCRVIYPANAMRAALEIGECRNLLASLMPPSNHPEHQQAKQQFQKLMQLTANQLAQSAKHYAGTKNFAV